MSVASLEAGPRTATWTVAGSLPHTPPPITTGTPPIVRCVILSMRASISTSGCESRTTPNAVVSMATALRTVLRTSSRSSATVYTVPIRSTCASGPMTETLSGSTLNPRNTNPEAGSILTRDTIGTERRCRSSKITTRRRGVMRCKVTSAFGGNITSSSERAIVRVDSVTESGTILLITGGSAYSLRSSRAAPPTRTCTCGISFARTRSAGI